VFDCRHIYLTSPHTVDIQFVIIAVVTNCIISQKNFKPHQKWLQGTQINMWQPWKNKLAEKTEHV